jgi:hypothetical protein
MEEKVGTIGACAARTRGATPAWFSAFQVGFFNLKLNLKCVVVEQHPMPNEQLRAAALAAALVCAQPIRPATAVLSSSVPPARDAARDAALHLSAALRAAGASRFAAAAPAPAPAPAPVAAAASRRRARAASAEPAGLPAPLLPAGVLDGGTLGGLGAPPAAPVALLHGVGAPPPPAAAPLASGSTAPLLRERRDGGGARAAPARGWFDLPTPALTDDLKRELAVLRNRAFLDPKRHYKTAREDRERALTAFSVGTVVEAPAERRARLSARERKPTMVDALLSDEVFGAYAARTMAQVHARGRGASVAAYKAKKIAAGAEWKKRRGEFAKAHAGKRGGGRARPRY